MHLHRLTSTLATVALGATAALGAGAAHADDHASTGSRSLATVLAADGGGFDKNRRDFDILDNAVRAVLAAKPDSPVGVLGDGDVALTAFAPTDAAFRRLATDVTGHRFPKERTVFRKIAAAVGVEGVESVLLYHVVPGATITYKQARAADGAKLTTALGPKIGVQVKKRVILTDKDRDDRNARVMPGLRNINKGNQQIAHGVTRVLRPIDLP